MARFDVEMILRLVDRTVGPLKAVQANLRALPAAAQGAMEANQARMAGYQREALGVAALGWSIHRAMQPAIAFESAMADVAKVVDFDRPEGLAALSGDILALSRDIPIAAEGLAAIVADAGQAGVIDAALPDDAERAALIAFTRDAAKMATAFDIAVDEAGAKMAGLRNIFGLNQDEVVSLADAVNHLSNATAAAAAPMVDVLERSGATAKMFGLSGAEASALAATLLSLQVPAEVAGTGINAMLMKMRTATQQNDKFQAGLKAIGLSAEGLERAIQRDAQGALVEFLERVRGSDDVVKTLGQLFGLEYADDMARLVGGLDLYRSALGQVADEASYAGSMQGEFAKRSATTENNIAGLRNRINELSIKGGSILLPELNNLLDRLDPILERVIEWTEANPELVRTIAEWSGGLLALNAGLLLGKLAFGALWGAILAVGDILVTVGALLLRHPIVAAIALIAGGAWLIWQNWEPIKAFFVDLWADIVQAFEDAWAAIKDVVDRIVAAVDQVIDAAVSMSPWAEGAPEARGGGGGRAGRPPGRAAGGPVTRGLPYIVGEEGPELFVPGASGTILPAGSFRLDRRPALALGGGGAAGPAPVTVGAIHVHAAPGQDARAIADEVMRRLRALGRGAEDLHDGAWYGGAR